MHRVSWRNRSTEIMGQSQRTLDLSGKTEFAFCRLCCEISEELFVTNTSIWKDNNCRILSKSIDEFIRAVEAKTAVYRTRNEMRNFAARWCLALPKTRDDLCVGMESAATCGILSRLGWPVELSSFSKSSWHHLSEEDIRKCIDDLVTNEQPSFFGDGTYLRI